MELFIKYCCLFLLYYLALYLSELNKIILQELIKRKLKK